MKDVLWRSSAILFYIFLSVVERRRTIVDLSFIYYSPNVVEVVRRKNKIRAIIIPRRIFCSWNYDMTNICVFYIDSWNKVWKNGCCWRDFASISIFLGLSTSTPTGAIRKWLDVTFSLFRANKSTKTTYFCYLRAVMLFQRLHLNHYFNTSFTFHLRYFILL